MWQKFSSSKCTAIVCKKLVVCGNSESAFKIRWSVCRAVCVTFAHEKMKIIAEEPTETGPHLPAYLLSPFVSSSLPSYWRRTRTCSLCSKGWARTIKLEKRGHVLLGFTCARWAECWRRFPDSLGFWITCQSTFYNATRCVMKNLSELYREYHKYSKPNSISFIAVIVLDGQGPFRSVKALFLNFT